VSEVPDQAAKLLALAREDLEVARMIRREDLSRVALGFHAQQAAEKALKAVLASTSVKFPFSHDLTALAKLCRESGHDPPTQLDDHAEELTPYAAATRYGTVQASSTDPGEEIAWAAATVDWPEAQILSAHP
jgi:HEPN domain-containing protein